MLGVVGSNLKMAKRFRQNLWMLHDVIAVWPGSCNNVGSGMHTSSIFNTNMSQHIATGWQNACNMLRSNVAIVWLELANAGSTMLGYVTLTCCYRLAWA